MTAELTPAQRDLLNYLLNAPRADAGSPARDLTIWWWLAGGPNIPELKPDPSPLFRAPAGLTPQGLDALAAAGLITIAKHTQYWQVAFTPAALAAGWDFVWEEPAEAPAAPVSFDMWRVYLDDSAAAESPAAPPSPAEWLRLQEELDAARRAAEETLAREQRVRLAQLLDETYDVEELQNLCFDLGLDYGNLRGERKASKARDLVSQMDKLGRLPQLHQALAAQRPSHYARLFGDKT